MRRCISGIVAVGLLLTAFGQADAALYGTVSDVVPPNNGYVGGADPIFNFTFSDPYGDSGFGTLSGIPNGGGSVFIQTGSLTLTSSSDGNGSVGTYTLLPEGPGTDVSPSGLFIVDNVVYPAGNGTLNYNGPPLAPLRWSTILACYLGNREQGRSPR